MHYSQKFAMPSTICEKTTIPVILSFKNINHECPESDLASLPTMRRNEAKLPWIQLNGMIRTNHWKLISMNRR
jgi:hypothetical protein